MHLVENRPHRIQCIALGGYPPPSVDIYVGRRDITDQLDFHHGATLSGAVLGMRRIDFRSERSTDNFLAQANDDRAYLRCVVVVPGAKPFIEFVQLDVDCKSTLNIVASCNIVMRIVSYTSTNTSKSSSNECPKNRINEFLHFILKRLPGPQVNPIMFLYAEGSLKRSSCILCDRPKSIFANNSGNSEPVRMKFHTLIEDQMRHFPINCGRFRSTSVKMAQNNTNFLSRRQ